MNTPPPERRRYGWSGRIRRIVLGKRARQNGVELHKIEIDPDIVMAALAVIILFLGFAVGFSLFHQALLRSQQQDINMVLRRASLNQDALQKQQYQLAKLETRDRIGAYQTAYRFCSRINIDRAAVQWFVGRQSKASLKALDLSRRGKQILRLSRGYMRRLQAKDGMPILNCEPNIIGRPATYKSPAEQRKFVLRWERHRLTPAEIGICRVRIAFAPNPRRCLK